MLSYPVDEAEELLEARLAKNKLDTDNCEEDLDFLREQITVSAPFFWEGGVIGFSYVADYSIDYGG